ncbi:MAG: hypothetical protein INQ03_25300 [Candidatus Heimdallarchaeota archaeon]|nr:hypothetical protein [Candidatus Heimdallarchaeota archaeon]
MKSKFSLVFLLVLMGTMGMVSGAPEKLIQADQCDAPRVDISITEGYYADLDGDGAEDDVFVKVEFQILCANRANFDYYVQLTQPSGLNHMYAYHVNTRLNYLTFENFFWNHAIESGDYQADAWVVLKTGGTTLTHGNLIFDPPGGSGTEPLLHSLRFY